jgi:hypothetical protein
MKFWVLALIVFCQIGCVPKKDNFDLAARERGPAYKIKDLLVFWRVRKKAVKSVSIHLPNEQNNARLRNPVVRAATLPI